MNQTITPFRVDVKAILVSSAVASFIALVVPLMKGSGDLMVSFMALLVIWCIAAMFIYIDKPHRKRSITITDDEVVAKEALRTSNSEFVFGGWMPTVTFKRSDIVGVEDNFQVVGLNLAASHKNLVISLKDRKYIVDGRIFDRNVVKLALEGKTDESVALFEKKSKSKKLTFTICTIAIDVFMILISLPMMFI